MRIELGLIPCNLNIDLTSKKILEYQNVTPCVSVRERATELYQNKEMVLKRVGPTCAISKVDFQFVNGNSNHPILQQTSTNLRNSLPKVAGDYQLTRLINQVCGVKTEVPHNFPMEDSLSLGFFKVPAGLLGKTQKTHKHHTFMKNPEVTMTLDFQNMEILFFQILFFGEDPGFSNPTDRWKPDFSRENRASWWRNVPGGQKFAASIATNRSPATSRSNQRPQEVEWFGQLGQLPQKMASKDSRILKGGRWFP